MQSVRNRKLAVCRTVPPGWACWPQPAGRKVSGSPPAIKELSNTCQFDSITIERKSHEALNKIGASFYWWLRWWDGAANAQMR